MIGRMRWACSAGLPVALSLGIHGMVLTVFCLVPTRAETTTRISVDTCVLTLDTQSDLQSATVVAASPGGSSEESEFTPVVFGVLPKQDTPAADHAPVVTPPLARTQSAGKANSWALRTTERDGPDGSTVGGATAGRPAMFGSVAPGQRVVYLLDRSFSMGFHHAFDHARRELLASLARLPATARFQIIAYNRLAEPIYLDGHFNWLEPNIATLTRVGHALMTLAPSGATVHERALSRALNLQPHVIYLVTDGDDLPSGEIQKVTRLNHERVAIHTIELSGRRGVSADHPLRQLAAANGGTYRQVVLVD